MEVIEFGHLEFGTSVPGLVVQRSREAACGWKMESGTLTALVCNPSSSNPPYELNLHLYQNCIEYVFLDCKDLPVQDNRGINLEYIR